MTADSRKHSGHTRHKRRHFFERVAICLLSGCVLSLAMTFLHLGSELDSIEHVNHIQASFAHRPPLPSDLRLSNIDCDVCGGPPSDIAKEMVYWQDIVSDSKYKSPFLEPDVTRYLTFEPDGGGFNNIRMSMETILALGHATGRVLVLPPEQEMYLLYNDKKGNQRTTFGFNDFFPMHAISSEQSGLEIISMEEFLRREGITGRLKDRATNRTSFPPHNRTNWDGLTDRVISELQPWQQNVSFMPSWDPEQCVAAFARSPDPVDMASLRSLWSEIQESGGFPSYEKYVGNPVSVYASAVERLKENGLSRERLCVYDEEMQKEPVIHFHGKSELGGRLLVHFYAFLFFQEWKQDLWMKRFIRDHVRYVDEIQCAAARIVHAVRERALQRDSTNVEGHFDAFHIRRGEFQYKRTRLSAQEIYEMSRDLIADGTTVYVATDERKKSFFKDMANHYDVVFLDDYKDLVEGINSNLYGMIDQLVASRSRVFFGCYFSTFTGYINRIRGYHADRLKLAGFGHGIIESYYYAFPEHKMRMQEYWPISGVMYAREFPTSWRNIDQGIDKL